MELGILDFNKLLSIWWSFLWRTLLVGSIAGALLGGLEGGIVGFASYPAGAGVTVGALSGWLVTFPVSIWALNAALKKKHKGYVIQLAMPE